MNEGKIPPQAVEVEESLLGTLIFERESLDIVRAKIGNNSDVFYKPSHRMIFDAICKLSDNNSSYDLILIENYLRDNDQLDRVGGANALSDLTRQTVPTPLIEDYADVLVDKYIKRTAIKYASEITDQAYSPEYDSAEVATLFGSKSDSLGRLKYTDRSGRVQDILSETLTDIEARMENPGIHGVPTGFAIDRLTGGWQDGSLYIIGARPSIGKTALALQSAYNSASLPGDKRTPVYYWNGEMLNKDMVARLIALESRVNFIKMRDGRISYDDYDNIVRASEKVYEAQLEIDDTPGIDVHALRSKYKSFVKKNNGKAMLCVDYIQLMSGHKEGTREQEISSIARALKETAKETSTPVIGLSQLSRNCLTRNYSKPSLADLRESGSIEQDADGVLLLNRPEFFGHNEYNGQSSKGLAVVEIAKMRQGATGEILMNFNKSFAQWSNRLSADDSYHEPHDDTSTPPQPHMIDFTEDDHPF